MLCGGLQLAAAGPERGGATTSPASNSGPAAVISAQQIQELRHKIAEQQKQIELLQKAVAEQQNMLDATVKAAGTGTADANANDAPTQRESVNAATAQALPIVPAAQGGPSAEKAKTSPLSFKIGNADFTPFGFVDFTFFNRSTNVGSGIGTGFGSIPFNNAVSGRLNENNFTAQNSRIGFRVDDHVLGAKVLGYSRPIFWAISRQTCS